MVILTELNVEYDGVAKGVCVHAAEEHYLGMHLVGTHPVTPSAIRYVPEESESCPFQTNQI